MDRAAIENHCKEAASFFDEMASCIRVAPTTSSVQNGINVDHIPMANLLEGCIIRLYRDRAEALRKAAEFYA